MKKYLFLCLLLGFIIACNNTHETNTQTPQNTQSAVNESTNKSNFEQTERGKNLFMQHCAACHGVKESIIGPALKGMNQKYAQDKKWLYEYIRNNQKLIREGDAKAIAISKSNPSVMNVFTFLTDEDIEAILTFVN